MKNNDSIRAAIKDPSFLKRFWAKIDRRGPHGCWLWTGALDRGGYGRVRTGLPDGAALAHRVAWAISHTVPPCAMMVCHNCPGGDRPACVNPAHLFLGNNGDNQRDAFIKGRKRGRYLNALIVRDLRLHAHDDAYIQRVAKRLNVNDRTIQDTLRGERWAGVR